MKEIDLDQLSESNGKEGQPALIAHQERIYDVSSSKLWKGGRHMGRHHAGTDLTTDLKAAPHGPEMLERFEQVGRLVTAPALEIKLPAPLLAIMERFPFLKRHPHPMTVHFPIVFLTASPIFMLLYLITGQSSFETTALHCLGGGLLFSLVAISTGWVTWRANYFGKSMPAITVKQWLSVLLMMTALITLVWRLVDPTILTVWRSGSLAYAILSVTLIPMIGIIGWNGAKLTFPIEEE